MKKFKKVIAMCLTAAMALSMMSVGAFAAMPNDGAPGIVQPRGVTPSTEVTLNSGESTQIIPWSVYSGYGYWKIYIENDSASTTKIKIRRGSPTGPQVGETMIIPAGQKYSFFCEEGSPLSTGAYYLDISTDGANNLNGTIWYKFATSHDDLL